MIKRVMKMETLVMMIDTLSAAQDARGPIAKILEREAGADLMIEEVVGSNLNRKTMTHLTLAVISLKGTPPIPTINHHQLLSRGLLIHFPNKPKCSRTP